MLIDSHVHLDDSRYDRDRQEIIENLRSHGLEAVVNIGADLESSRRSFQLAKEYPHVYGTVGIHPHSADTYGEEVERQLTEMAKDPKIVAIGEIGLDFYYDNSPRDVQRRVFRQQLELAHRVQLPVVIHSREASQETYDILRQYHQKYEFHAIIHCFSQSVEMMREYVKLGDFIALGGAVTFKNAKTPKEVAREVPLDRLILETDCPYMTPVPFRGKRNEPKYIEKVAAYIAELRGISMEELVEQTDENTRRFYGL